MRVGELWGQAVLQSAHYFVTSFRLFFIYKTDLNVLSKRNKKPFFTDINFLLVSCQPLTKKAGSESGSSSQWDGSADTDPDQDATDPQHWLWIGITLMTIRTWLFHFDADPDPDPTLILSMLKIQENFSTFIHSCASFYWVIFLSVMSNIIFSILYISFWKNH